MALKQYDDFWGRRRLFRSDPFWDMNLRTRDLTTSDDWMTSSLAPVTGRRYRSERISQMEKKFDDMVRKVDARFSGIMTLLGDDDVPSANRQKIKIEHEGKELVAPAQKPKDFALKIDVQDFRPEEVKVKVQGGQVFVHAKRESKNEDDGSGMYAYSLREFKRAFTVPQDVDIERLTSSLTTEGILQVDAPAKSPAVGAIEASKGTSVPVKVEFEK